MSTEKTLSIIKPDAVKKNVIGKIISRFEENGLYLVAAKLIHLSDEKASGFYAEHIGKSFFEDLIRALWKLNICWPKEIIYKLLFCCNEPLEEESLF